MTYHIRAPLKPQLQFVLLSAKADLRAAEIVHLTWDMAVDATGRIGAMIELRAAKVSYLRSQR
jgi:hypothetical protein